MINFSRSVFLCFVVSAFMLAFTRDGDAAMSIMRCPYRPDCANYQGKRDILNWRSEVREVSLVIWLECWVKWLYHKNSILKCYKLFFLQFLQISFLIQLGNACLDLNFIPNWQSALSWRTKLFRNGHAFFEKKKNLRVKVYFLKLFASFYKCFFNMSVFSWLAPEEKIFVKWLVLWTATEKTTQWRQKIDTDTIFLEVLFN